MEPLQSSQLIRKQKSSEETVNKILQYQEKYYAKFCKPKTKEHIVYKVQETILWSTLKISAKDKIRRKNVHTP